MNANKKSLDYFLNLEYSLNIIADPDGGYVVEFPDLPGCITQGDTLQEALYMAEDARAGWIETECERSDGDIPMPSYPDEYSDRLPKSLHSRSRNTPNETELARTSMACPMRIARLG